MRRTLLALGAIALSSGFARAAEPKVDPSLAAFVAKFNEAFNRYDPQEVSAFWAKDGSLITPGGEWGRGRAEVAKVYGHDVDAFLRGTTSMFRVTSVRSLKDGLALLDLDHEAQNAKMPDGSTGTMKLHVVILAQKKGKTWHWLDARPYAFLPPAPPK